MGNINLREYMLSQGDSLIDEVIEDRKREREKSKFPQTPYPLVARENPNYVVPRNLPKAEERSRQEKINNYKLGSLSAKYESLKDPAAIGYDKGGGYSYGTFQIETKHGTMKDYLDYLAQDKRYQNYAKELQDAGGYFGASGKANSFVKAWKKLAKDTDFVQSQYNFIFDKKLTPLLSNVAQLEGGNLENRHPVVKDVLFSLAVQHGQSGAWNLIKNALGGSAKGLDDATLINKLYDERSNVDKYLSQQSKLIREKIKLNRYPYERSDALKALSE